MRSDSISIKIEKNYILLALLISLCCCGCAYKIEKSDYYEVTGVQIDSLVEKDDFYAIYRTVDARFLYEVYDLDGNVVWRDILYKPPTISIYDSRYIEVKWGGGTGVWSCKYYDMDTCFITQSMECARYIGEGLVGIMVDAPKRELHILNPFSYSDYFQVIQLDFSNNVANPSDTLLEIMKVEEGGLQIEYLGVEDEIETVIVDMGK